MLPVHVYWAILSHQKKPSAGADRISVFCNPVYPEIAGFVRAVGKVARDHQLVVQGYRLLTNTGKRAGQEVPHLHVHVFGGQPLGPMLAR